MNNGTEPLRILIYGDFMPSGFGRIAQAVGRHLNKLGYQLMGADLQYDGILPHPARMPFHVAGLAGRDLGQAYGGFAMVTANVASAIQPDVVISVQDFPYHLALRATRIDWSVTGHIVITPVDGAPVYSQWLQVAHEFDALMTISEFGVAAFREAGVKAALCPPGVDTSEFYRLPDTERTQLRAKLNIPAEAFVVGVMAMNQGRKDFPAMVRGFADAYRDCPDAYLFLDCMKVSPAGWDIPEQLLKPNRLDAARVRFKEDAVRADPAFTQLNQCYNLLDLHMVISEREGYGLPHGEAMATGIPSISSDYCSGPEIIGNNERGWLVESEPTGYGTWGGAQNHKVKHDALVTALREAYDQPEERKARGARARDWVKSERTWERAALAVAETLAAVIEKRRADFDRKRAQVPTETATALAMMPAGIQGQTVINVNAPIYVNGNNADEVGADLLRKLPPVGGVGSPLVESVTP